MADEALDAASTEAGAPAGDATTQEVTPEAVPEPSEWDDPEPLTEGQAQFDRDYVEKLRDREAKYRIRARENHEVLERFGGAEKIEQAVGFFDKGQTEEGVTQLFIEAGQALGLSYADMEALFNGTPPATEPTTEATGPADDEVMTYAEFKAALQKEVLEPQQRAAEAARAAAWEQTRQTAAATVTEALKDVPEADRKAVLALGTPHIADGDFDPDHIRAAVRKGVEELATVRERDREAYLKQKLAELGAVPSATAGSGAAGASEPAPPANWEEAKARARERIKLASAQEAAAR